MPSPRYVSVLVLILLGLSFAGANLWIAAARSTIPRRLHGKVTQKRCLIEKTPGVDDVYIVTLDSDQDIQVDREVFNAVADGHAVEKSAWSRTLSIDGHAFGLGWSRDFHGMLWAMPLAAAICVALGRWVIGHTRRIAVEPSDVGEATD